MPDLDVTAAHVRFLVLRSMPMLVADLEAPDADTPARLDGGLFQTLTERGLAVVSALYDEPLPKGAQVGFTLTDEELRLEDDRETSLLRVARRKVDPAWRDEALRMKGTMLYVGRNLGMSPELSPRELCDLLERAAGSERVAAAIVGVAEETTGLPMFG